MPKYISPKEFEVLVNEQSNFLITDYGCLIVKISDWQYFVENETTRVIYLIEGDALTIGLEPIGYGANQLLRLNIIPSGIEVYVISECLDSSLHYDLEIIGSDRYVHNIQVEIKKRTILLSKYCKKMLQGDFSEWPDVEKCL